MRRTNSPPIRTNDSAPFSKNARDTITIPHIRKMIIAIKAILRMTMSAPIIFFIFNVFLFPGSDQELVFSPLLFNW